MSGPTNAQLTEQLAESQRRLEEVQATLNQQRDLNKQLASKGEGWLITTPNPLFNDTRFGVKFTDGIAFILRDQEVAAFVVTPMSDGALHRSVSAQYPPPAYPEAMRTAEKIAIREREKVTSADRAVEAFINDLGFKAEYYDADNIMGIEGKINQRAAEAQRAMAAREMKRQAEM